MEARGTRCSAVGFATLALRQDVLLSRLVFVRCPVFCLRSPCRPFLPQFSRVISGPTAFLQVRDCFSNWAALPEALLVAFPVVLEIVLFHQRLFLFFTAEGPTVSPSLDVAVGIYAAPSTSPQPLHPRRVRAFTLWPLVCVFPAV